MAKNGIATVGGIGRGVSDPNKRAAAPAARNSDGAVKARVIEPEILSPGSAVTGAPDLSGLEAMPYRYELPRNLPREAPARRPGGLFWKDGLLARLSAAFGVMFAAAAILMFVVALGLHHPSAPAAQAAAPRAASVSHVAQPVIKAAPPVVQAAALPASSSVWPTASLDSQAGAPPASIASDVPSPPAADGLAVRETPLPAQTVVAPPAPRIAAKARRVAQRHAAPHVRKPAHASWRDADFFADEPYVAPLEMASRMMRRLVGSWR